MVPDGCFEDAFIESAGADNLNDRTYVTFGGLPPEKLTGKGKAFVEKYKEKHKKDPEGYAVYGYECAKVALKAIEMAGKKDRNAIREACLKIKGYDGALGKWSFDKNGDTTNRTMSGQVVKGGKFEFSTLLGDED
jgi:branched-chain amino acid transport system substrate-binding protein